MPAVESSLGRPGSQPLARIAVRNSIVMELMWALYVTPGEPEPEYPARARRFESDPSLPGRITALWADGESSCLTEIFVAAERGGVLFETDPERLWAGLEAGAAAPPRNEAFESETEQDRERFRNRLDRLREDPELRQAWVELLRDTWAAVSDQWEAEGRGIAESLVWELQGKLPEQGSYADLAPLVGDHDFNGLLPRLVGEYAAAGLEVVITPSYLGRKGFLVSLSSCLLWGPPTPSRPAGPSAETRDRARRYKALGDPTRLAIFESVAQRRRTVGELAAQLGIAQPTVSNHVRILRDAGLLIQEKGDRRRLAPDLSNFERFLDNARRAVVRSPQSMPSPGNGN